ncbi:unnamed protein product [Colias eurytheme]|nr:unnamed protein product [Colias eurytheme]
MKIVKNILRNKISEQTLNSILLIRNQLKIKNKDCSSYDLLDEVINQVGKPMPRVAGVHIGEVSTSNAGDTEYPVDICFDFEVWQESYRPRVMKTKRILLLFQACCYITTQSNSNLSIPHSPAESNAEDFKVQPEEKNDEIRVGGNRIVDFMYFYELLLEISHHNSPLGCNFNHLKLLGEKRKGFVSKFEFVCKMCNLKLSLKNCKKSNDKNEFDLNENVVSAFMSIGSGYAGLEQVSASLEIPSMSDHLYAKCHTKVCELWETAKEKYIEEAAKEEFDLAVRDGNVNADRVPMITVVADGWKVLGPKSYRNLYHKAGNEKDNLTVLVKFNASGEICPLLIVFPYIRPPKSVTDSMPKDWNLGRSESGWMNGDIVFEYIVNDDFNKWINENNIKKTVLLVDVHKSHIMSLALNSVCEELGIIYMPFPRTPGTCCNPPMLACLLH